ncbi:MAG TPA: hypothetical protein VGD84_13605 [Pseudonocardiaceae bacterium]
MTTPVAGNANRDADGAVNLLSTVNGRGWIAGGLSANGSMAALDATMRPIEALSSAGLGVFTSYVQPLQTVLDRMAGNASAVQTFADAWQRAATTANDVYQQLTKAVPADTAGWRGAAADQYRGRMADITAALRGTAALSSSMNAVSHTMGQVVSSARPSGNDLLTDLIRRLISYAQQARTTQGGLTPSVLAQATSLINSYQPRMADLEQNLMRTIDTLRSQVM